MKRNYTNASVQYNHEDRQWDIRLNVPTDEYLQSLTESIMLEWANGKFKYILIGGIELGTKPYQDDYKVRHVHIAVIFNNRASKSSIITNWGITEGHGYYMVPRNRDLPYSGWRDHHIKEYSKIDATKTIIFENGELPKDYANAKSKTQRSEAEKKDTTDNVLRKMRELLENGKDEEAFQLYPRNYILYGERLKTMLKQKASFKNSMEHPHIWLHGWPGTGKTQIMKLVYPNMYKKDLGNRFFDLFDKDVHTHIMLEDLDHQNVDKLGIQFLKTLCDEAGFPIDQKYKTPQLARATVLVTSNFIINDVVPEGKGVDETKVALHRRFVQIRIDNLLRLLELKMLPLYERTQMKKRNEEKCIFMTWNYNIDCPMGLPIKTPEEYQKIITDNLLK